MVRSIYPIRAEFVRKCGELLNIAKPNFVSCEIMYGIDIPKRPVVTFHPDDQYVVVTCESGFTYEINIEACSLAEIAAEIFLKMLYK